MLYFTLPDNETEGKCRINGAMHYYYRTKGRLLVVPMQGDKIPPKGACTSRPIMQAIPSPNPLPNPAFPGQMSACTSYICR